MLGISCVSPSKALPPAASRALPLPSAQPTAGDVSRTAVVGVAHGLLGTFPVPRCRDSVRLYPWARKLPPLILGLPLWLCHPSASWC